jgi:hypothetical protein
MDSVRSVDNEEPNRPYRPVDETAMSADKEPVRATRFYVEWNVS